MPEQGLSRWEMGQHVLPSPWGLQPQPGHPLGTMDPGQKASLVIAEEAGCFLDVGTRRM